MYRIVGTVTALAVLLGALPAQATERADPVWRTSGWAGYVVRNAAGSFTAVRASWTEAHVVCNRLDSSMSTWVGLGGTRTSSTALEQIGTSADCDGRGTLSHSAWYQLYPSPPVAVPVTVRAGDVVRSSVTVNGATVTLALTNVRTGTSFSVRRLGRWIETDSAEWIVEAPAACFATCVSLPLPDFGRVRFVDAWTSTEDHAGPIGDGTWTRLRLEFAAGRRSARASALSDRGSSFAVALAR